MRVRTLVASAAAVTAAAAVGSWAAQPGQAWYRRLEKPAWQPPPVAFPIVWTGLYALLAAAGARALDAAPASERAALRRSYGTNLALNAGWTAVFFRARRPAAALVEIAALNASNIDLLRRFWRSDRLAGVAVLPYVAWTGFATALNAAIVRRN